VTLPQRFSTALAGATLLLVFIGGLVTSTHSGLAVPDWPLSYGRIVLPMRGAVLYEHGHRLAAASIGLLSILTAVVFQWKESRRWLRGLAWGAVGLVVLQGLFGGLTVLYQLKKPVFSIVHACLAQSFFVLTVSLAVLSSNAWKTARERPAEGEGETPLHQAALLLFLTLFLQLVLGAVIRHTGHGVLAHMLLPGLALVLVGMLVARVASEPSGNRLLDRAVWALPVLLAAQAALGLLSYLILSPGAGLGWSRAASTATVTAHVAGGALLLGTAWTVVLLSHRTAAGLPARGFRRLAADHFALTKPGISVMTALTTLAGYVLGARGGLRAGTLLWTAAGTLALAGSAGALNMWREREADGRMRRTEGRPLPAGRLAPAQALFFGALLAAGGLSVLALSVNLLTAALGAATLGIYIYLYTPLKTRSPWSTAIGAVAGALPPVMGWAAAAGSVGWEALALFGILFFWQFPHFYALAWLYREDYARGGFSMLPVVEPDGESTARKMVTHGFALLTVSLLPAFLGMTGTIDPAAAFFLGAGLTGLAGFFFAARSRPAARGVFLGSVIYLPLLLGFLLWDRR
jgi:heme o synthase